jgi:mannitol-1-/sugar-/sorbitol-6-phosphatase
VCARPPRRSTGISEATPGAARTLLVVPPWGTVTRYTPRDVELEVFEAVLFDMDGTLLSSVAAVVRAWTTLAIELAIPPDRFGDFHGMPARDLVERLLHDRTSQERRAALDRVTQLELDDLEGITVLPGAAEALAALVPAGRCAVVTSSARDLAHLRLRVTGLRPPAVVVSADDVARGKPDPEPFVQAAEALSADPARCLVVEDATAGARAGGGAGAAVVGLRTTSPDGPGGADLIVHDLASLRFEVGEAGVRVRRAPVGGGGPADDVVAGARPSS